MSERKPGTQQLLRRAKEGDQAAGEQLLDLHRESLRRMIAVRMDRRMSARVDPSDVVQDALAEASRRFEEYLRSDDQQFVPWLRRIAWEKLVQLHRYHIGAQRRTVEREVVPERQLGDRSAARLSRYLVSNVLTPSAAVARKERRASVRAAIDQLDDAYREVMVLRHLEQLSFPEVAEALDISRIAAQSRYRRALEKLHHLLSNRATEGDA